MVSLNLVDTSLLRIRTNPKTNKIPSTPLPPFRFNRLQIVIEEHKLGSSKARLTLDGQLLGIVANLGLLDFLHDEVEDGVLVGGMDSSRRRRRRVCRREGLIIATGLGSV